MPKYSCLLGPDQLSPWNSRPGDLLISSLCVIFRFSFKKDFFLLSAFASSDYNSGTLLPSLHIFYIGLNFRVFWPHRAACGILVAQPGIEPAPPALEVRSLNHRHKGSPSISFEFLSITLPSGFFVCFVSNHSFFMFLILLLLFRKQLAAFCARCFAKH